MFPNRSRFPTELDDTFEAFITNFFFSIGTISSILSVPTFYLLFSKSSFLTIDVRVALMTLQLAAFLNHFHFCILFVPFLYPYVGGGFCTGVLCLIGVRFHYGMCFWLFTIVLLSFSFIILVFARMQTLLSPYSKLRLGRCAKLGFYAFTFSSLVAIPALFFFTDSPYELQVPLVEQDFSLDWIADKKVFSLMTCCYRRWVTELAINVILGNIIVLGTITLVICALILRKIVTANVNRMSNHAGAVYRAKIKNSVIILSQMATAFCLGVLPFCIMMATVKAGADQETARRVVLSELCTTLLSPINSIIFIFGNKQYASLVREMLRRSSTIGRSRRSISIVK